MIPRRVRRTAWWMNLAFRERRFLRAVCHTRGLRKDIPALKKWLSAYRMDTPALKAELQESDRRWKEHMRSSPGQRLDHMFLFMEGKA